MSLFEKASRMKLRFDSQKGPLSVEDLWDIPLDGNSNVTLDKIALELYKQSKAQVNEISFVHPNEKKENTALDTKFELVKYIIDIRVVEREKAKKRSENARKRQELYALIQEQDAAALKSASREDLLKKLAELEDD